MSSKKVMVVFGTRPEAIKLAPVIVQLVDNAHLEPVVVVTGQHRHMLDQVLEMFAIEPHFDLDIERSSQCLSEVTSRVLEGFTPVVEHVHPDLVMVQGDTSTTLAAALGAFFAHVPVAHVEAGLRTGNISSPFPEEMNRRVTSQLTALHLAPTWEGRVNLVGEGVKPDDIVVTGNTVIDALLMTVDHMQPFHDPRLRRLDFDRNPVILVTAHRRESWDGGLTAIGVALRTIAQNEPQARIVFPIHKNPVVRQAILPIVQDLPNVIVTEPLDYVEFVRLMASSSFVLTDSGGIQEEAPSLGKPVLVTRNVTERLEGVAAGAVRMVGTDTDAIVDGVEEVLHDRRMYERMAHAVNPYGDGHAADRTIAAVEHWFGYAAAPDDFHPVLMDAS